MTSLLAHSIGLSLVLGDTGVNMLDNIRSDRAGEDSGDGVGSSRRRTIFADDGDGRSRSHCEEGWDLDLMMATRVSKGGIVWKRKLKLRRKVLPRSSFGVKIVMEWEVNRGSQ